MQFVKIAIFLVTFLQSWTSIRGQCEGSSNAVNVSYPEGTYYVFEGDDINVTVSVEAVTTQGIITFQTENQANFELVVDESFPVTPDDVLPKNLTVMIHARLISISELRVRFKADASEDVLKVGSQTIAVKRIPSILQTIYIYTLMVWIVLSYLSMGGTMDLQVIWARVRRPWGVIIGIFCQFIIMPVMTYYIAKVAVADDPPTALGIIIVGTCPGGWLSNVFSVLLDVDFVLSLTMTFFSSIIAMGMMPLNLFIYATPYAEDNARLETPFGEMAQQLALLVVPCFIGIGVSYRYPKFRTFCSKVMKPIGTLLIVLGVSLAVPADLYAFTTSSVKIWVVSIITPAFGAFFGLSFARIFARDIRTSITIALETGIQNALLGRTIIGLFYPQPEADLIARVMLVNVVVTLIEGVVASVIYSTVRYLLCRSRCDDILGGRENEDGDEEKIINDGESKPSAVFTVNGSMKETRYSQAGDGGLDNPCVDLTVL
nr:ileal sodium/bile acid cotransporter-like [Lytechinus pictus]